jgi:hypothetical protein
MKSSIGKVIVWFSKLNKLVWCECCIHFDASWFSWVQKAFKICLGADQIFWDFSGFLQNYSLSYFYLLESSKILFMSSKYFIWIVHVLIYLREFSWNFCDFLSIFRALKHFLVFFWNLFLHWKYFKKNNNEILSYRFGPSPHPRSPTLSTRPNCRPAKPIRGGVAFTAIARPPPLGVRSRHARVGCHAL